MHINKDGWIEGLRHVVSPNNDERPADMPIDLLVIHNISLPPGEFGGPYIEELFCNQLDSTVHPYFEDIAQLKVSSHILIRRDGEIIQFVPLTQRAWHAGESSFCGQSCCNDYSIGIELEGTDDQPFTDDQYESLAKVSETIIQAFPSITAERIAGHSDIAPGRKTDPGEAFDWSRYKQKLSIG